MVKYVLVPQDCGDEEDPTRIDDADNRKDALEMAIVVLGYKLKAVRGDKTE